MKLETMDILSIAYKLKTKRIYVVGIVFLIQMCTLSDSFTTTSQLFRNPIQCANRTCAATATCVPNEHGVIYCQCYAGYTGDGCYNDMDECTLGNPCFYRGFCHNNIGSYWCECLDGWEKGNHCETPTAPPENRKCVPGHFGDWCFDTCLNNSMCGSDRECKKHGQGLGCVCKAGWQGDNCTDDVDECRRSPCRNSGTCINVPGSYLCECPPGWQGDLCTDDLDECLQIPCQNNGTCHNSIGSYSCACDHMWTGGICENAFTCRGQSCIIG